ALVSSDYRDTTIAVRSGGLISAVEGTSGWEDETLGEVFDGPSYTVEVPARTLSSLLDEAEIAEIDLFSLDVEGYEEEVLRGLDLGRHAPHLILVEIWDAALRRADIEALIAERYELMAQLTERDFLYGLRAKPVR